MSIDKVGGPGGAAGFDPIPASDNQASTSAKPGERSVSDVANQAELDTQAITEQSLTSPRDVSTGQATGKRSFATQDAPRFFGEDIKLSAAHLPQLQGGASSSTPAADKSAKYEHSQKFSKLADKQLPLSKDPSISFDGKDPRVPFDASHDSPPLSKDPRTSFDGKDPRLPLGAKDPRIPFDATQVPQVQGGVSNSTPAADKSAKFEHSKVFGKAEEVAGKIAPSDQKLDKDAPLAQKTTTMFEITQDVTVNKAKTADKAFTAMDGYIKQ